MKVKMILPALKEATSPFWRPIKYSLFPPLGLATLAGYLPAGTSVELQDEHVERLDLNDEPDLVVIQVYITSARRAYAIADHYRKKGAHVALGGLHVTSLPEEAMRHADTIFLGPGEDTWPAFLKDYLDGRPGRVYRSTVRSLIGMPAVRRDLIKRHLYLVPNSIVVSRGCPHTCDFCYKVAFFKGGRGFYTQQVDQALAEIDRLPGRHLYFLDDHLFGDPRFAAALFDGMKGMKRLWQAAGTVNSISLGTQASLPASLGTQASLPASLGQASLPASLGQAFLPASLGTQASLPASLGQAFLPASLGTQASLPASLGQASLTASSRANPAQARMPAYPGRLLEKAVESGLRSLFVGFETLNRNNLVEQNKYQNLDKDYTAAIRRLQAAGVMINGSFVFGMDDDDETVFDRTVEWAITQGIETATFHILTPYPGTALYQRMQSQGRMMSDDWDLFDTRHVVFKPARMTPQALEAGYWRAYKEFYKWGSIARGALAKPGLTERLRHVAYAGGWKKFEPLWDWVIRAKRVTSLLPMLEAVLTGFGSHPPGPLTVQPEDVTAIPQTHAGDQSQVVLETTGRELVVLRAR